MKNTKKEKRWTVERVKNLFDQLPPEAFEGVINSITPDSRKKEMLDNPPKHIIKAARSLYLARMMGKVDFDEVPMPLGIFFNWEEIEQLSKYGI